LLRNGRNFLRPTAIAALACVFGAAPWVVVGPPNMALLERALAAQQPQVFLALCCRDCATAAASGIGCVALPVLALAQTRERVRQRYNINGSETGDFCTSCLCPLCAVAQQQRELAVRTLVLRRGTVAAVPPSSVPLPAKMK
jgi:Cys-rich protein (TIGR01571 family)